MTEFANETYVPPMWDVFKQQAVSDIAKTTQLERYYPTAAYTDNNRAPLKFSIPPGDGFIIWENCYIVLDLEIVGVKHGAATPAAGAAHVAGVKVGPVNNIGHSLFRKITTTIQNNEIFSINHYAYVAHLNTLLNHDKNSLSTYCRLEGWLNDCPADMENIDPTKTYDTANEFNALGKRRAWFSGNKTGQFLIKPWIPSFKFETAMIPGVETNIVFERYENGSFYMMGERADAANPFEIKIKEAVLYIHKIDALPDYANSINSMIEEHHFLPYNFVEPQVLPMTIQSGSPRYHNENVFQGEVPSRIIIVFVDTRSFEGNLSFNPFHYQHINISSITLEKNGKEYPIPTLKCDFEKYAYTRAYYHTMNSLQAPNPAAPHISYDQFRLGSTIFSFDMSPDQLGGTDPHAITNKPATVRLTVDFKTNLTTDITCLIYYEIDKKLLFGDHLKASVEKAYF